MQINKWLNFIHFRVFTPVCVLCAEPGSTGMDLCVHCRQALPRLQNACVRCAEPLQGTVLDALCGRCQQSPPTFERTRALFTYETPVDHLLQALKFNGRLEMARVLGSLMAKWLAETVDVVPDVIIPVPLHASRLRERGFNQSLELGRFIARELAVPLDTSVCQRIRATASQRELSRKERLKNLKGAFVAAKQVGGHVAILDDVMTTGSTANELAKVLLKAGAKSVEVWVCARA